MGLNAWHIILSRAMRKLTIWIYENKGADQLRSNCEAGQSLCFRYTYMYVQFLFFLNAEFPVAPSQLLCFYSWFSNLFRTSSETILLVSSYSTRLICFTTLLLNYRHHGSVFLYIRPIYFIVIKRFNGNVDLPYPIIKSTKLLVVVQTDGQ